MIQPILKLALIPGAVAALIAVLTTPLVIKFAKKLKIIDDPRVNKHLKVIHRYPVPRMGGLATFLAILIASLIFLPLDKHLTGILAGAALITLVGILDDKYNLNPYLRLALCFVAAAAPIAAGIGISFISNPAGGIINLPWILSDVFGLFWLVFIMNMLNMGAKGVDGQLPGVVVIASLTIAALSLKFSADITQWPIITLAAVTAGAYLGFLPWNFYPQKIMPGYSGSTLAGYILAILAILSTTKVGILMIVLGVPLIDTGYTIVRRIVSGKSPVWGDRGHLHHRLLAIGWGKRKVAVFYWAITAILGLVALNLNTTSKLYTMVAITIVLGGTILWLTYRQKQP